MIIKAERKEILPGWISYELSIDNSKQSKDEHEIAEDIKKRISEKEALEKENNKITNHKQ